MLALDTNVLVRFLVKDDEVQSSRAAKLIARAVRDGEHLFVSDVVLCEVVWALSASYGLGPAEIANVLEQVLKAAALSFPDSEALSRSAARPSASSGYTSPRSA